MSDDTTRDYVLAADLPRANHCQPTYMAWGANELGWRLIVRFNMDGTATFDPYWQCGDGGWDHYFAPKRFDYLPQLIACIRDYVAEPTEGRAREIHNRRGMALA